MKAYLYDGSFEGLLTAIFYAYGDKEEVRIERKEGFVPDLLHTQVIVDTEEDKFKRVYNSILIRLSKATLDNVYFVYLSELPHSEEYILKYLKLCYKFGPSINLAKNNEIIDIMDKWSRKVTYEAHRFKGFVRFEDIGNNTFYSSISPDHNIIPLIGEHFARRFSDEFFIIHDTKRNIALIYNKEDYVISSLGEDELELINSRKNTKDIYEDLFREFYKAVNIKERKNEKLRANHMPRRYWKNMTEFK